MSDGCVCREDAERRDDYDHGALRCVWCVAQGKLLGSRIERAAIVTFLRSFEPFSGCDAGIVADGIEKGHHLEHCAYGLAPALHKRPDTEGT